MNMALLRQTLAAYLGVEQYRKFVQQLSYGQRMRYWQETAWRQFVAAHAEWVISEDELRVALRVCWVHGAELLSETVTVGDAESDSAQRLLVTGGIFLPTVVEPGSVPGHVKYSLRTGGESCPCAMSTEVIQWTEGCPFPPRPLVVWYCLDCRQAYEIEHSGQRPSINWSLVNEMVQGMLGFVVERQGGD
jgi:hypothetical protein